MAAVTLLSELGGQVLMDSRADELWISRKADGTCQAAWLVGSQDGITVNGVDTDGNLDEFLGIALPRYDTDVDTAYTATNLVDIVIPQGGHLYVCKITDPAGTLYAGEPLSFGADGGALTKSADIESEHVARLFDDVLDNTIYATIIWGV